MISQLRIIGEDALVEGANLNIDVAGPFLVYCQPKAGRAITRAGLRKNRNRMKLNVFVAVDMYSHRIKTAVLDSMDTDTLTSALYKIMGANGWKTWRLILDPGSSLVPAAQNPIAELEELKADPEEGHVNPGEMDPGESVTLVQNLRDSGFQIRTPFSKASYRQAYVESSIRIFKRTLKSSLLNWRDSTDCHLLQQMCETVNTNVEHTPNLHHTVRRWKPRQVEVSIPRHAAQPRLSDMDSSWSRKKLQRTNGPYRSTTT